MDLTALPATELARLIAAREVSSRDVVEAHLERIEAVNGDLRAVIALRAEKALAEADRADAAVAAGEALGPLHGVPFTVKDWIETDDLPCVAGFEARLGLLPKRDATAVARLRAAGAILLGKTKPGLEDDTHPRARNPRDPTRTAGGSSGGEASIIGAGGSPLGLGSDSGGSLRWPAHCCGVATIRPTVGRVPNTGHFPRINPTADPRTAIGPLARTVDDLELALDIISGIDFFDSGAVPVALHSSAEVDVSRLRVAWFDEFPGANPSDATREAVTRAAATLRSAGATVEAAVPPRLAESLPLTRAYWSRPESASWSEWNDTRTSVLSADRVERSLFEWDRFRRAILGFMRSFDIVLCPVADGPAPLLDVPIPESTWLWMLPWALTGYPVVTIPAGEEDGLPLGVQVVARPWEEHIALAAAKALEAARMSTPLPASRSALPLVAAVSRSPGHTMTKPNAAAIRLVAALGVEGDAHAGETVKHRSRVARDPSQPNLRQVHLIHAELFDELRQRGFEVAPGVMGENVTTRGIDLLALPAGTILQLGATARVQVTGLRNPCAQLDGIAPGLMAAVLDRDEAGNLVRKAGIMAVVLSDGEVRPRDAISVELPAPPHAALEPV